MVPFVDGIRAVCRLAAYAKLSPKFNRWAYGALADQVATVYPAANFPSPQDALVRVFGDSALVCPTYDTARRAAAGGSAVWLHNFARPVQRPLASLHVGATHDSEFE